jgi:general secretion pathway protein D
MHLQYAKATDVATLLNSAFTARKDNSQQDNPFFIFYSDMNDPNRKKGPTKDYDDQGHLVNVRDLTGKVNVIADPNTNNLVVVTVPSNLPLIQKIIDQIDKVASQVMIETVIVEANLNKETKLGVEFNFLNGNATGSNSNVVQTYGIQGSTPAPTGLAYTLTGTQYKAFLNAVQNDNRFKVLDTPRIFTSNNIKATIDVSTKVPYITSQSSAVLGAGLISNYSFLPVGVILTVTPRVTASGEISMDIDQSADDLQGYTSYNAPIVNHREATTTVSVKNGDTVILGGIIQHNKTRNVSKIPILGDIPFLGALFRSTDDIDQDIELMVLMTPRVVNSPEEAQKIREEELKKLSNESQGNIKKARGGG